MKKSSLTAMVLCLALLSSARLAAQENRLLDSLNIHGSLSGGYLETSDGNNLMRTETSDGTWRFNEFLLNSSYSVTDEFSVKAQIISRSYLEFGDNSIQLDWGFFEYYFTDAFGVRLGRNKTAPGLYGDIWDVDAARVTPLMPLSTYNNALRDFLISSDGIQFYGDIDMGSMGSLSYQLSAGYKKDADENSGMEYYFESGQGGSEYDDGMRADDGVYSLNLNWDMPIEGLRFAGSYLHVRNPEADMSLLTAVPYTGGPALPYGTPWFPGTPDAIAGDYDHINIDGDSIEIMTFAFEYTHDLWDFSAELYRSNVNHFRTKLTDEGSNTEMKLDDFSLKSGGYNLQGSRYIGDNLQAAVGFGQYFGTWSDRWDIDENAPAGLGGSGRQDIYVAAKYNITGSLTTKVGVHYLRGLHEISRSANTDYGVYDPEPTYFLYAFKLTYTF